MSKTARHQELRRSGEKQHKSGRAGMFCEVIYCPTVGRCKMPPSAHMFGDDHRCAVIHEGHCFFCGHWAYVMEEAVAHSKVTLRVGLIPPQHTHLGLWRLTSHAQHTEDINARDKLNRSPRPGAARGTCLSR